MNTIITVRPTSISHANTDTIADRMRTEGRTELVHYAGAAHRDHVAWQMCLEWQADPRQAEHVLKARSLAALSR